MYQYRKAAVPGDEITFPEQEEWDVWAPGGAKVRRTAGGEIKVLVDHAQEVVISSPVPFHWQTEVLLLSHGRVVDEGWVEVADLGHDDCTICEDVRAGTR